jgi:hypothetical protein
MAPKTIPAANPTAANTLAVFITLSSIRITSLILLALVLVIVIALLLDPRR